MKTLLTSLLIICFWMSGVNFIQAQQLPAAGDRTFEIGITPLGNNPVNFDQFRLRSFQNSDTAYRLRVDIYYESERTGEHRRDSRFDIELAPGIEWHALQQDPLSVYYGAEVGLRYRTSRQQVSEDITNINTNPNGFFGVDVNALVGFDLHFLQYLYTGAEVGYGIRFTNYLDQEVNDQDVEVDARDFYLRRIAYPRIRLGMKF